jgi:hypothetical protein
MIPKIDIKNNGFGNCTLVIGKEVPTELAVWVRIKTNDKFIGQPAHTDMMRNMARQINADLYKLIEQGYIKYIEFKNEWVVLRPLFKWVKGR